MEHITAPDFPTGGVIHGMAGVRRAYRTGQGIVQLRARTHVEEQRDGRERIIVTEIPFLVDKSTLLEKMADLVRNKVVEDISNLRDESGRDGLRIVIELKRGAQSEVVLNQLFSHSMLQQNFGVNAIAIVDGRPKTLNLKRLCEHYLAHRHEVVLRRTRFDLSRAEARAHLLEGLRVALDNIDAVIELIRSSADPGEARGRLMAGFALSEIQASAILSMPLQRLTGLEREKIEAEYQELQEAIGHFRAVLDSRDLQMGILKEELSEVRERFGDDRRTEIVYSAEEFDVEDLIPREDMVVTISREGYVKRMSPSSYRTQHRGEGASPACGPRKRTSWSGCSSPPRTPTSCSSRLAAVPLAQGLPHPRRGADRPGTAAGQSAATGPGDEVRAVVPVDEFTEDRFLFTATRKGVVKKTVLSAYGNVRRDGIIALKIQDDDDLIGAGLVESGQDVLLATRQGMPCGSPRRMSEPWGGSPRGLRHRPEGRRRGGGDGCSGRSGNRPHGQ